MALEDLFDDVPRVSVSQYTAAIKKALEKRIPPAWVIGEVSNLRSQASGHLYFSLKDAGAQVPAVMFRGQASRLKFELRDGMQVLAFGEISVYEPHGRYQLVVRELEESGEGRLHKEFERLKRKLSEEGLFDSDRKRALPVLPLRVAIVTSPTGAALQDFARILKRRGWGGRLRVHPVRVQGAGAAEEIDSAIRFVNELESDDLIVIARGGGSIEDLWAFNEERVARSVFESRIPIVSAVGHEIDFTLGDFAADARAETPSGAAEMISTAYIETIDRLELARSELDDLAATRLVELKGELRMSQQMLKAASPMGVVERAFLSIDELRARFLSAYRGSVSERRDRFRELERRLADQDVAFSLRGWNDSLDGLERRMELRLSERLVSLRGRLDVLGASLRAMSPQATLDRGFALLEDERGGAVTDVGATHEGARLKATVRDGSLSVTVDRVVPGASGSSAGLRSDEDLAEDASGEVDV